MADIWHTHSEIPSLGSKVIANNIPGTEDLDYEVWEIDNGTIQTEFINSTSILRWCYWGDVLSSNTGMSTHTLACIKEGTANDWAPTNNGYVELEYDTKALRQQINARLQTLPNEVDNFDGIDYWNIIFGNTSWAIKAQSLGTVIKDIPSVLDVEYIAAQWVDKEKGEFSMTFSINSIFGNLNFIFGLNNQNKTITLN